MGIEKLEILEELLVLLRKKNYEYNDLGDDTGVLISIDTGKILTLNAFGNKILGRILDREQGAIGVAQKLEALIAQESALHHKAEEQVRIDVSDFLQKMATTIGAQ